MVGVAWTPLQWLAVVEYELMLFAGIFFLIGALDELAMDFAWLWFRLTGKTRTKNVSREHVQALPLEGRAAVLIPAWQEEHVIAETIAHALAAWPQESLRIYAGCYCNDSATVEAVMRGSGGDPRVRLVIHGREGPTTKADCLNRLYEAMETDERRGNMRFRQVMLHDAEDMVDPAALVLADRALAENDFVQLPVLPERQAGSRWVGSHYCEEFAEAHGKAMVVRSAVRAALPAAGVGCAFSREMLDAVALDMAGTGPFSRDSLTEDYELGLRIKAMNGRAMFLRARGEDGKLIATRACFPTRLDHSVRQKARWVHGIALQGWDRLGWGSGPLEIWMRMRDRRGPLTALVLFCAYVLLALVMMLSIARYFGLGEPWRPDPVMKFLLVANFASFGWRALMRFAFTAREYGPIEGVRAVLRIPIANVVAIMAGRRAFFSYLRTLRGAPLTWEKTSHYVHPAALLREGGKL